MAILNYGNQFRYNGDGYVDSKMAPVKTVDDLERNMNTLIQYYTPGMKVTVIDDGEFGAVDYVLSEKYEWKRLFDLNSLTLSLDKGDYDSDPETEYYLQLHYTNSRGELVALGETLDLSLLLEDVEARIEALENKEGGDVVDTNTFIESASIVTEYNGENGIFIKFVYNDGNEFATDITMLEPKTYSEGVGVLIGENNVVSVDEAWFDEWFEVKTAELIEKLSALETEVTSLSQTLATISSKVDTNTNNISSLLSQISANKTKIEEVESKAVENETKIATLSDKLAKIRGIEVLSAGNNISIEEVDGNVVISANVPEIDTTEIENRLSNVESVAEIHTSDITALQEAIKNLTPEGESLSGDNVTIKTNEQGFLTVMLSLDELNVIKKNSDGLFVQGIEMVLGDDEINEDENN